VSNYLCETWQGFLQQIVYQVARGYVFFCLIQYSDKKREKWLNTDKKLITKYNTDQSKDQRYRRKAKQLSNFIFLRWENWAVVLHTFGSIQGVVYDDKFKSILETPLQVRLNLEYKVHRSAKGEITVHLSRESYQGIKSILAHTMILQRREKLIDEFNRINGLPCWGGIVEQKAQLLDHILRKAPRYGIKVKREDFRFTTRRKVYTVFSEPGSALSLNTFDSGQMINGRVR